VDTDQLAGDSAPAPALGEVGLVVDWGAAEHCGVGLAVEVESVEGTQEEGCSHNVVVAVGCRGIAHQAVLVDTAPEGSYFSEALLLSSRRFPTESKESRCRGWAQTWNPTCF